MLLTGDEIDAQGFIDIAQTCGARVLYFDSVVFAAEEFAVWGDDGSDAESGVEDELSLEAQKELKRLRRAARAHARQTTVVVMCFVAEGLPRCWSEEAAWHADLQDAWTGFTEQNRLPAPQRAQDARQRADAEAERIAAGLADNPEFRAATKRTHRHGIAGSACPPPVGADDEKPQEHQRIVRRATNRAIDLGEEASRRIYAGMM
ncbi:hypothetical protein ABZ876_36735 [Streptomyces sp. NPDC046931]|uniref:hypothetical protein n=1 Tax=Streptomyces sp. NPDC046931 TaxID=3154806 RepID=UPI0033C5C276